MTNLDYLLEKVEENKIQIINLINAQYILRFAHNSWYFEEKILEDFIDREEVKYQLKLVDNEGLEIIREFFKEL